MTRAKVTSFQLNEVFGNLEAGGRETSEAIVRAIKESPQQVFLKTISLAEHIDTNYINEFLSLPDYNVLTGYLRCVLVAVYTYIRQRLCPTSRRLLNQSLTDMVLLESLHSVLLKGLIPHSMPRVVLKWVKALGNGDAGAAEYLNSTLQIALDCISRGDAAELKQQIESATRQIPGWATLQMPNLNGWTLLHYAASINRLTSDAFQAVLTVLMGNGITYASVDYHHLTPLHVAARYCSFNAIEALAKRGGRSARNASGQLPLHLFLQQLPKVSSTVHLDYRLLVFTVKALLPGDDPLALLHSCSAHRHRSGLAYCLLYPDRELGHAILGLMANCVSASNAAEAYPVLLDTLVVCIRHKANSFYSSLLQMLLCCQPIYQSQQPFRLHWEVFSVMISTGLYWHNSTATYWAIDHLSKQLEFRQANAQSSDLFALTADRRHPIPWKWCVYSAVLQNDDRVLTALLKKLPIQFVFPLLAQQDGFLDQPLDGDGDATPPVHLQGAGLPTNPSLAPFPSRAPPSFTAPTQDERSVFDLHAFVRQDVSYLADAAWLRYMDRLSLLNMASLIGHPACVSVLLKHLFINQSHLGEALLRSLHQQSILLAAMQGHLSCLHILRDSLGMHRFAEHCFSPLGALDLSLFEWVTIHLRRRLDRWIPNGDDVVAAGVDRDPLVCGRTHSAYDAHCEATYRWRASITAHHQVFSFLLQHIHLVSNLRCHVSSSPLPGREQAQRAMTGRIASLMDELKDRLLLSSLPESDKLSCPLLIAFLRQRNANVAQLVVEAQRCYEKRSSLKELLLSRKFVLRACLRKLVRAGSAWVPSASWLKAGYILVALLDMLGNKFGAGYLPGQSQVQWSDVLRAVQQLIQSRETFLDTMHALADFRPAMGSLPSPRLVLTRERWMAIDLMASDPSVQAVFKPPARPAHPQDSTGVRFNKDVLRNNLFQGDASLSLALHALSDLIDLLRDEGRLWFGPHPSSCSPQGLVFPCHAAPPPPLPILDADVAHTLATSDWFRDIQATLTRQSLLVSVHAVHELELVQHCAYFVACPRPRASLVAVFLDKSLSRAPACAAVDRLLATVGHVLVLSRRLGLVSNAENALRIANAREHRWPSLADRAGGLAMVDDVVCQLIGHSPRVVADLASRDVLLPPSFVRDSLLPFLLPLLAWRCYAAVNSLLDVYSAASPTPAVNPRPGHSGGEGSTLDYHFMSSLAFVSLLDWRGTAAAVRDYRRQLASDTVYCMHNVHPHVLQRLGPSGEGGPVWQARDVFLLTPVHLCLADGQLPLLGRLLATFPLLSVPLEGLVSFVHELGVYSAALQYLVHVDSLAHRIVCPSVLMAVPWRRTHLQAQAVLFLTAVDCLVTSSQRYLADYPRHALGQLHASLSSHLCAYAVKILRTHAQAGLHDVDLVRDMCLEMMDGSHVLVRDVLDHAPHLSRALPRRPPHAHYHLVHCLAHAVETLHCVLDTDDGRTALHEDGLAVWRRRCLEDLLDHVVHGPASALGGGLHTAQRAVMADCQGDTPLAVWLRHRLDGPALACLRYLAAEVGASVAEKEEEEEDKSFAPHDHQDAYLFLVRKYTRGGSSPAATRPPRHYLLDVDDMVLARHAQRLEAVRAAACPGADVRRLLPPLRELSPGQAAGRGAAGRGAVLSLAAVLRPPTSPPRAAQAARDLVRGLHLADPLPLLHVCLQYAQYLYSVLVQPCSPSPSSSRGSGGPMASFLQYALSGPYGKLDVFLRARQVLSLLALPSSVLCRAAGPLEDSPGLPDPDQEGEGEGEGERRPSSSRFRDTAFPAQDALRQCRQLSHGSYRRLMQVVTGFFRHRCLRPPRGARCAASSAVEDALLAWHSPWLSCLALGSSGRDLASFLERHASPPPSSSPSSSAARLAGAASVQSARGGGARPRQTVYAVPEPGLASDGPDSFDVLRVLQRELASSLHAPRDAPSSSVQGLVRDGTGPDTAALVEALDTAYLVVDLARYLCLSRTLLVVTQDMHPDLHPDLDLDLDPSPSSLRTPPWPGVAGDGPSPRRLPPRRHRHPLLVQHEVYVAALAEHDQLARRVHDRQVADSEGSVQRLGLADGVTGEALGAFFRLPPRSSGRLHRLRRLVAGGLAALLLDLGQASLSELVCRLALAGPASRARARAQAEASPPRGGGVPGARLADTADSLDRLLAVLQRLTLQDFSLPPLAPAAAPDSLPGTARLLRNRFARFKKHFDSLCASLAERREDPDPNPDPDPDPDTDLDPDLDRKEWYRALATLRDGQVLTPLPSERRQLLSLFDNLSCGGDVSLPDALCEAEHTLATALQTGSRLYWLLQAVYGLLRRAEGRQLGGERDVCTVVWRAQAMYASGAAHPLLAVALRPPERRPHPSTDLTLRYLVHLAGLPPSSAAVPHLSPRSLLELLALRGEAARLQVLLPAAASLPPPRSFSPQALGLGGHLVFHTLLAMPGPDRDPSPASPESFHGLDGVRRGYTRCVSLLLSHHFPALSPCGEDVSCLDLAVLRQAWDLLPALAPRPLGDVGYTERSVSHRGDVVGPRHGLAILALACVSSGHTVCRDTLRTLVSQRIARGEAGEALCLPDLARPSPALASALQTHLALQTESQRLAIWVSGSSPRDAPSLSLSLSPSPSPAPPVPIPRGEVDRLGSRLHDALLALVRRGDCLQPGPVLPLPLRDRWTALCPWLCSVTASTQAAQSPPVLPIDAVCRAGDSALLPAVFEATFPSLPLDTDRDAARASPDQVAHLARLVCIALVYGHRAVLDGLLGLLSSPGHRDAQAEEGRTQRVVRRAMEDLLCPQAGDVHGLLGLVVGCPHTASCLDGVLSHWQAAPWGGHTQRVGEDACVQLWLDGVRRDSMTEGHAVLLLRHLFRGGARSDEDADALAGYLSHCPAGPAARGGRLLHVLCARGWARLAEAWLDCVGVEEMAAVDEHGLAPWQVSVALGHGAVSRALQPFLPWAVKRAVSDVMYCLRLAVLTKAARRRRRRMGRSTA